MIKMETQIDEAEAIKFLAMPLDPTALGKMSVAELEQLVRGIKTAFKAAMMVKIIRLRGRGLPEHRGLKVVNEGTYTAVYWRGRLVVQFTDGGEQMLVRPGEWVNEVVRMQAVVKRLESLRHAAYVERKKAEIIRELLGE
jgi:hypothetical protein